MARNKIKIITKKYMNIKIQRRNDKCIMDEVLQSNLSKSKKIQVNACMLYLRIIYLSDIVEPDGKLWTSTITLEQDQHTQSPHLSSHVNPTPQIKRRKHGIKCYKLYYIYQRMEYSHHTTLYSNGQHQSTRDTCSTNDITIPEVKNYSIAKTMK